MITMKYVLKGKTSSESMEMLVSKNDLIIMKKLHLLQSKKSYKSLILVFFQQCDKHTKSNLH